MSQSNTVTATTGHGPFWFWLGMVLTTVTVSLIQGPNSPHFWLFWEGGAMFTSTLYTMVFYFRLFRRDDDSGQRLYKGIGDMVGLVPLFCAGSIICLALATTMTLLTSIGTGTSFTGLASTICWRCDKNILPLIFLVLSGIFFCLIDLTFARLHSNQEVRKEFRRGLLFNGLPVSCAFALLLLFVCRFNGEPAWGVPLKSFIGGAVAFVSSYVRDSILETTRDLRIVRALHSFPGSPSPIVDIKEAPLDWRGMATLSGPSGSGKTTLFRVLCGWYDQEETVCEFDPPLDRFCKVRFVGAQDSLLPWRSVESNLRFRGFLSAQIDTALAEVGLDQKCVHGPYTSCPTGCINAWN